MGLRPERARFKSLLSHTVVSLGFASPSLGGQHITPMMDPDLLLCSRRGNTQAVEVVMHYCPIPAEILAITFERTEFIVGCFNLIPHEITHQMI